MFPHNDIEILSIFSRKKMRECMQCKIVDERAAEAGHPASSRHQVQKFTVPAVLDKKRHRGNLDAVKGGKEERNIEGRYSSQRCAIGASQACCRVEGSKALAGGTMRGYRPV